jgi:hypothetical protein
LAEISWLDIITRYVIPPILGGAGGLITTYAQWGIEKRRQKLQIRRDLVAQWRRDLIPALTSQPETSSSSSGSKYGFMDLEAYASIRPLLKAEIRKKLEDPVIYINMGGLPFPRVAIMEEIARIEREWRLI